jgi:putative ABC transport system permease protein
MNNFIISIKIAWRSMVANKVRTGLTVLGIVIGIASVIIVYSAGEGIRGLLVDEVQSFGTDIVETEIKVPTTKKGSAGETQSAMAVAEGVQVTTLTLKDMEDINKLSNVQDSYATILAQEKISYGSEVRKAFLMGVSPSYINIDNSQVESGRFFSDEEDRGLIQVAVLGSKMKDKLFGDSEALDKYVTIRREKFRVVGVMEARGAVMSMDFDDYVYVPVRTLQKKVMGIDHLMYMIHQLRDMSLAGDTAEEIKQILRTNHDISDPIKDDFRVATMDEMMDTLNTVTDAITWLLLAIVIISLIVGGVGILNIMYVIVSERTAEIGLRKAVGANYNSIMMQFLTEAVLITLFGAVIGIIFGVFISWIIAFGASSFGLAWKFSVPLKAFVVSLTFAFACGLFFGVYPARRAARMDPVEALRKE